MTNTKGDSFSTMSAAIGDAHNYVAWIVDSFRPFIGTDLLEIGTGFGSYRRQLLHLRRYASIDIDEGAVMRAAATDTAGVYAKGDVSKIDFIAALGGAQFDTVLCANVLEHVEEEGAALDNMLAALRPGGHLLLFVPAHPQLYSDMDRLAGHLRRYTRRSLRAALADRDGTISMLRYFNPIGGLGWWANRLRRYKSLDDRTINRQIEFFDRWVVPASRALDPLTRGFFGQSLMAAVRK